MILFYFDTHFTHSQLYEQKMKKNNFIQFIPFLLFIHLFQFLLNECILFITFFMTSSSPSFTKNKRLRLDPVLRDLISQNSSPPPFSISITPRGTLRIRTNRSSSILPQNSPLHSRPSSFFFSQENHSEPLLQPLHEGPSSSPFIHSVKSSLPGEEEGDFHSFQQLDDEKIEDDKFMDDSEHVSSLVSSSPSIELIADTDRSDSSLPSIQKPSAVSRRQMMKQLRPFRPDRCIDEKSIILPFKTRHQSKRAIDHQAERLQESQRYYETYKHTPFFLMHDHLWLLIAPFLSATNKEWFLLRTVCTNWNHHLQDLCILPHIHSKLLTHMDPLWYLQSIYFFSYIQSIRSTPTGLKDFLAIFRIRYLHFGTLPIYFPCEAPILHSLFYMTVPGVQPWVHWHAPISSSRQMTSDQKEEVLLEIKRSVYLSIYTSIKTFIGPYRSTLTSDDLSQWILQIKQGVDPFIHEMLHGIQIKYATLEYITSEQFEDWLFDIHRAIHCLPCTKIISFMSQWTWPNAPTRQALAHIQDLTSSSSTFLSGHSIPCRFIRLTFQISDIPKPDQVTLLRLSKSSQCHMITSDRAWDWSTCHNLWLFLFICRGSLEHLEWHDQTPYTFFQSFGWRWMDFPSLHTLRLTYHRPDGLKNHPIWSTFYWHLCPQLKHIHIKGTSNEKLTTPFDASKPHQFVLDLSVCNALETLEVESSRAADNVIYIRYSTKMVIPDTRPDGYSYQVEILPLERDLMEQQQVQQHINAIEQLEMSGFDSDLQASLVLPLLLPSITLHLYNLEVRHTKIIVLEPLMSVKELTLILHAYEDEYRRGWNWQNITDMFWLLVLQTAEDSFYLSDVFPNLERLILIPDATNDEDQVCTLSILDLYEALNTFPSLTYLQCERIKSELDRKKEEQQIAEYNEEVWDADAFRVSQEKWTSWSCTERKGNVYRQTNLKLDERTWHQETMNGTFGHIRSTPCPLCLFCNDSHCQQKADPVAQARYRLITSAPVESKSMPVDSRPTYSESPSSNTTMEFETTKTDSPPREMEDVREVHSEVRIE